MGNLIGTLYLRIKVSHLPIGRMTMWEYKVLGHFNNKKLEVKLNKLGREGWEVIAGVSVVDQNRNLS